jgi:hypothetical protein
MPRSPIDRAGREEVVTGAKPTFVETEVMLEMTVDAENVNFGCCQRNARGNGRDLWRANSSRILGTMMS